jgi:hypothetical protein
MDSATLDQTSQQFLGQWQRLVSTTNWEKGRIIYEWRTALIEADASSAEYSDDAWSRQVGNVTPQHTGRLRRVYERFEALREGFQDLYWSHFQAALDWDDAEMWLEGAVQNQWSIAAMRQARQETLGQLEDSGLVEAEDAANLDEDAEPIFDDAAANALEPSVDVVRSAERSQMAVESEVYDDAIADEFESSDSEFIAAEPVRPFAQLGSLPVDLSESFESFKLCILKHKMAGWAEIARDEVLAVLDALKEFAMAPASD